MIFSYTHDMIFAPSLETGELKTHTMRLVQDHHCCKAVDETYILGVIFPTESHMARMLALEANPIPLKVVFTRTVQDTSSGLRIFDRPLYKLGQNCAAQPARGKRANGRIKILEINLMRADMVNDALARREGFQSAVNFLEVFDAINGPGNRGKPAFGYGFEVIEPADQVMFELRP
jgi:hypothetical protein